MKAILIAIATVSCVGIYSPISSLSYRPIIEYFEPISFFKEQPVIWEQKIIKRNRTLINKRRFKK